MILERLRRPEGSHGKSGRDQQQSHIASVSSVTPVMAIDASNSTQIIHSVDQFSQLPLAFESLVDATELGVNEDLSLCMRVACFGAAQGSSNARYCLLVNQAFAYSDEANELVRILKSSKSKKTVWEYAERIIVPDTLLISISKGETTRQSISNKRQIFTDPKKSAFFKSFRDIVKWGMNNKASDVHFNLSLTQSSSQISFTIYGHYVHPQQFIVPTLTMLSMLNVAYMNGSSGNGPSFDPKVDQQWRIELNIDDVPVMLRCASVSAEYPGPSVSMRLIVLSAQGVIPSLEKLTYLPDQISIFDRALRSEHGAMVMAGIPNSGKSYTLASIISRIPAHRKKMGIEDPVELIIPGMIQKSSSRSLEESDEDSFSSFKKTIKRSAMNDLLLGEIRDEDTGELFVDMVLMGNAVWTTTHSASHLGVYDKFLSRTVNIDIDFLTTPGNIKAIAYQALMPNLCDCSLPLSVLSDPKFPEYQPSAGLFSGLISELYDLNLDSVKVRNPYGCPKCKHPSVPRLNGLIGRTLAAEVIEPDDILLGLLKKRDHVGMADYVRSLRGEERFDSIVMNGKSAMECAVYKMSLGQIDPRDVEVRFHSFEKESMIRKILAKRKASL